MKITDENKKEFQERFAHALRSFRHKNDLTQQDLAEKLKVTVPLVTKFESTTNYDNRAVTSYEFFKSISEIMEISCIDFIRILEDDGVGEKTSPWIKIFKKILPSLRADVQFTLFTYLNDNPLKIIQKDFASIASFLKLKEENKHFFRLGVGLFEQAVQQKDEKDVKKT